MGQKHVNWTDRQRVNTLDLGVMDLYHADRNAKAESLILGDGVVEGLALIDDSLQVNQVLGSSEDSTLGLSSTNARVIQTFQALASNIQRITVNLRAVNVTTQSGNFVLEVYSLTTPSDPSSSLNAVIATQVIDVGITPLSTSISNVSFDFASPLHPIATPGALTVGNYYAIVFRKTVVTYGINFVYDNTGPYLLGEMRTDDGSTITPHPTWDMYFKIYSASLKIEIGKSYKNGYLIEVLADQRFVNFLDTTHGITNYFCIKFLDQLTDYVTNPNTGVYEPSRIEDIFEIQVVTTRPDPDDATWLVLGSATIQSSFVMTIIDERVFLPKNSIVETKVITESTVKSIALSYPYTPYAVRTFSYTPIGSPTLVHGVDYWIFKNDQEIVDDLGYTLVEESPSVLSSLDPRT